MLIGFFEGGIDRRGLLFSSSIQFKNRLYSSSSFLTATRISSISDSSAFMSYKLCNVSNRFWWFMLFSLIYRGITDTMFR